MAFCEHCLKEIEEGLLCADCAAAAEEALPYMEEAPVETSVPSASGAPQFYPQFTAPKVSPAAEEKRFEMPLTTTQLPTTLKPLGAWGFFWYSLLFWFPLVGFVAALVCACGGTTRVCVKNYARGVFLCRVLLWVIAGITAGLWWYFRWPLPCFTFDGFVSW